MEAAAMGLCFISLKGKNYSGLHFSALVALMLFLIYAPIYFNGQIYVYLDIGADTYAGNWCSYIFLSDFWDHLQSGWWSFSIGLGNNLFVFADHLFDPFNLVLYLFRQDYFVDGIFAATLAKYAATAFFAYQLLWDSPARRERWRLWRIRSAGLWSDGDSTIFSQQHLQSLLC